MFDRFARAGEVLRRLPTVFGLCVAVLLGGCARKEQVRIGLDCWPGYEYLFLAEDKGFFEDEGLDVKLVQFPTLADTRHAFERGQLDVMAGTPIELLLIRDNSTRQPQAFLVTDVSNGADNILAAPSISSVTELKGKRIGVALGCLDVFLVSRMMEGVGATLDDVVLVSGEPSEFATAAAAGQLDAVVSYPAIADTMAQVGFHPVWSTADIPGEVVDFLMADAEFAKSRPRDLAAICRAYDKAQRYAATHSAETIALFSEREGITPAEYAEALSDGVAIVTAGDQERYLGAGGSLVGTLQGITSMLVKTGQTTRDADPNECVLSRVAGRAGF